MVEKALLVGLLLSAGTAQADDNLARPTVADVLAWDGLPILMLGVAADTADRAVTLTGADVTEVKPEEDTYERDFENGIEVVYAKAALWCGNGTFGVRGVFCWENRSNCTRKAKGCRASKNARP